MPRKPTPALVGGPYGPPPCQPGSSLVCRVHGRVTVSGLTDAPIQWPYWVRGQRSLVVAGDLVRAVRTESAQAVAHHWGVDRRTVTSWRQALGVGSMTRGTRARWVALAPGKLPRDACAAGGRAAAESRRRGGGAEAEAQSEPPAV